VVFRGIARSVRIEFRRNVSTTMEAYAHGFIAVAPYRFDVCMRANSERAMGLAWLDGKAYAA